MSETVSYDELIDLLRGYLTKGSTGLIAGLSDQKHSFQIGFHKGRIVLLTYRVFRGEAALENLLKVNQAKITEHLNVEPPDRGDGLDTSMVMARLIMERDEPQGIGKSEDVTDYDDPTTELLTSPAPISPPPGASGIDREQIERIKSSATHFFGPIASMVCEDYLTPENLASVDLRTLIARIAGELGASDSDMEDFFNSVSKG